MLTNYTFPISYSSNFYQRVVLEWNKYSCYAYLNDVIVGAITCRVDELDGGGKGLYILTLATLEPYRRGQIATQLYEEIYRRAQADKLEIEKIYLHTPQSNEAAIRFYEKLGFVKGELKHDYYNALEDKTAVTIEKPFDKEWIKVDLIAHSKKKE